MNDSLSILLPVHNAQATLAGDVFKMLDLLGEVARRFDLVIVNDGSTDATVEIAHELAVEYPQVRLVRHSQRRGFHASLERALEVTDSQVVLGHVGRPGLSTGQIERHCGRSKNRSASMRQRQSATWRERKRCSLPHRKRLPPVARDSWLG